MPIPYLVQYSTSGNNRAKGKILGGTTKDQMPKYFHYTTVDHIPEIQKDGFLKLVESNVSLSKPHKGPDVVWLFSEPLTFVPKMLHSRLMRNGKWTGYVKSKAEVELEITLEKALLELNGILSGTKSYCKET